MIYPQYREFLKSLFSEVGERQLLNVHYMQKAIKILGLGKNDESKGWLPEFEWLFDAPKNVVRVSILAELGRIEDPNDLYDFALAVCKQKPKTKIAVVRIRNWRLGKNGEGDAEKLGDEIRCVIANYIERFPKTKLQQIFDALEAVWNLMETISNDDDQ